MPRLFARPVLCVLVALLATQLIGASGAAAAAETPSARSPARPHAAIHANDLHFLNAPRRVIGAAHALRSGRFVVATEEAPQLATAFHHTTSEAVDAISREGLFPGSYATPTSGLSPLQAHIELALDPAGGARNAILEIDVAGMRQAGLEIPEITRVTGANGMAGGGYEMQFLDGVPPEFIKVIQP